MKITISLLCDQLWVYINHICENIMANLIKGLSRGSGLSTVRVASLGVSRVGWDTLQVIMVPGGFLSGCRVRWEEREYVPSLCCRWLEREDSFDKETGSSSEGAWENHSTCRTQAKSPAPKQDQNMVLYLCWKRADLHIQRIVAMTMAAQFLRCWILKYQFLLR